MTARNATNLQHLLLPKLLHTLASYMICAGQYKEQQIRQRRAGSHSTAHPVKPVGAGNEMAMPILLLGFGASIVHTTLNDLCPAFVETRLDITVNLKALRVAKPARRVSRARYNTENPHYYLAISRPSN